MSSRNLWLSLGHHTARIATPAISAGSADLGPVVHAETVITALGCVLVVWGARRPDAGQNCAVKGRSSADCQWRES